MTATSGVTKSPASETGGPSSAPAQGGRARLPLALAATLAGWIVLSTGLGVGLPRSRDGVNPAILAAIGITVGAGLLAIVATLLVRVTRGWTRLILIPWTVVVLVGVYSLSIALAAVYPPHPVSNDAPPAGAIRIDMRADDGVHLSGWYLPSRNRAAVVLRHGAGSTAADVMAHAQVLSDAGYGVLVTDARGHGASSGQGMDLGWYGDADIRAAVDALTARPDVDPRRIGIVGLSMGGEEAIGAAGVDRRIRAVVAEGATGRTAGDKAWLADEYGVLGVVQGMLDAVTYGLIDVLTAAGPPPTLEASLRRSQTTPVLLVAAGDSTDERSVASRLATVDPTRVQVWVVLDAGHVQGLNTAPSDWRDRVVGFLDASLQVASP
jgi:dienelactone hydrolase